nr:RYamide receptor-like [Danaus plexippus plexippus]
MMDTNVTIDDDLSCLNGSLILNDTRNNYTLPLGMVCILEPEPEPEDYLSSSIFQTCVYIMYGVVFIVALLGNGLVCCVVQSSPRMKTVTNYFILNLAVGDILMTLFCVPFSFVSMLILRYWPFGGVMCKVVNYSQAVSVLVSAYTLLAISIDRYFVITRPLRPRLGKTAAKLVMSAVWLGALATAAPILVVSQLQKPSLWHQVCELDICSEKWEDVKQSEQYTSALLILQFALPLMALVCTYGRIACVVWGVKPPGEAESVRDSRMQHSKLKMLWSAHENDEEWGKWPGMPLVWFVSHWLAMSHSCYNPIIYGYMNVRYRNGFRQVLERILKYNQNERSRSCPRTSICEGIPLSEMVAINGSMRHRSISRCKCKIRSPFMSTEERKCSCSSIFQYKTSTASKLTPPAQALSVLSH